jgi:GTP cyclohydrolase I
MRWQLVPPGAASLECLQIPCIPGAFTLRRLASDGGCRRSRASSGVNKAQIYNKAMQHLVRKLLAALGEDPDREGLVNTPVRVEKALKFLTSGYCADIDQVLNNAMFTVDYSEMVIVRDIDFYSLCEHHLLPFFGKCHVAYIPSTKVIGLSKIPRLVDVFSRRLQVQERLTNQIANTIQDKIAPIGVAVVVEATHLCMSMRGVEKQNSFAVTSAMLGAFRDSARTRMEFLELIKLRTVPGAHHDPSASLACMAED